MFKAAQVAALFGALTLCGGAIGQTVQPTTPVAPTRPPRPQPPHPPQPPLPPLPVPGDQGGASNTVFTNCSQGTCTVTINGVTKTYPGSSADVSVTNVNGVTTYLVLIDGQAVPF